MEFRVQHHHFYTDHPDCIISAVFENCQLSSSAEDLDRISKGYIRSLLKMRDIQGKIGESLLLYHVPQVRSDRLLLIGCGKEEDLVDYQYQQIIKNYIGIIKENNCKKILCYLAEINIKDRSVYWKIRRLIEETEKSLYNFDHFKSNINKKIVSLNTIILNVPQEHNEMAKLAIKHAQSIASAVKITKDLSNLPPNVCNTSYLAKQIKSLAKSYNNIDVKCINELEMKKLGMNAYLAVGQGSKNESIMSIIEYKGCANNSSPIALVGKGVTFDSGGLSLKPATSMEEMKYDMCGAAAVYGVLQAVASLEIPLNIIGIIAGCENMPGGQAFRPGDVITTMSGITVEILNTDAEGRLILCDVLTYVEKFQPKVVIDIATLTGACVVALGTHITGLISNNKNLVKDLLYASEQSGDLVWQLPLREEYKNQLISNCADLANVGGSSAGAITAAYFLSQFTQNYAWAHLDIAGTAWKNDNIVADSSSIRGSTATGRPVELLVQYLLNYVLKYKNTE
ncbi:MAG: leucyl aminopeptidase [Candidatus Dasytiphilus stammeri]